MGRGFLTKDEIEGLKKNPYVIDVNEKRISYSGEFKLLFIEKYLQGEKPTEIFRRAGFDVEALGSKRIERACARWKESYRSGTLGMYNAVLGGTTEPREYIQQDIQQDAVEKSKKSQIELCHEQARQIKQLQSENERLREAIEKMTAVCGNMMDKSEINEINMLVDTEN